MNRLLKNPEKSRYRKIHLLKEKSVKNFPENFVERRFFIRTNILMTFFSSARE